MLPGTQPSFFSRWNPWAGLGTLPRGVWILSAAILVNRMGTMVLPFLILYLTESLGFPLARAGLVLTVYGVTSLVLSPLAGRLSDHVGPGRVMKGSLLASGAVLLAYPLARTWPEVIAVTVLLAACSEGFRPASLAALASLAAPADRKAAFALGRLAINLGMSIGPVIGGFLARVSYPSIFWIDGATSLLAAAVLLVWFRGDGAGAGQEPSSSQPLPRGSVLADGRLLAVLGVTVLTAIVFFQSEGAMPPHLVRNLGYTESTYGLLLAINPVLIVFLEVRLNLATAHWPHSRAMCLGALLLGAGLGALAFAEEIWSIAATVVVWTFGEMVLLPATSSYISSIAPPAMRGRCMGLLTMSWAVALSVGPWLGTEMLVRLGPRALWISVFAVSVVAAVIASRLPAAREGAD